MSVRFKDSSVSIVVAGAAGSGIQTVEQLLIQVFKAEGFYVYAMKEYMSRIRGGSNSTEIRISSQPVAAPLERIDLAIPLDRDALGHLQNRLSKNTLILGEKSMMGSDRPEIVDVPFSQLAIEAGNKLYANNVAVSVVASILGVEETVALSCVKKYFAKKAPEIVAGNIEAIKKGYAFAQKLTAAKTIDAKRFAQIRKNPSVEKEILWDGAQAVSLGALAGGCNFIAAYPMSPSTGVLTFLSAHAKEFDVVAEQAEDEIAGINMCLGASYAGARALASSAGGGFALMVEGVSLCGMIETPLVIHLAQRPAPATGLPTRTEQGDLELALYAGHGFFPRAILAPSDPQSAFTLTQKAFELADQYQIPVFVLTDQHLIDSNVCGAPFDIKHNTIPQHIVATTKDYRRYALTKNGISPRGIPGNGEGLVLVDSDEHDEWGRITESMEVRNQMVAKRLRKLAALEKDTIVPTLCGPNHYKNLIVCWGSTFPIVREVLDYLALKDTALLNFGQIYPFPKQAEKFLKKAKRIISVENNVTGQFAKLLTQESGFKVTDKILKYDGLPFFVDTLAEQLASVLKKGGRR